MPEKLFLNALWASLLLPGHCFEPNRGYNLNLRLYLVTVFVFDSKTCFGEYKNKKN